MVLPGFYLEKGGKRMKKLVTKILVFVVACMCLAGCGTNNTTTSTEPVEIRETVGSSNVHVYIDPETGVNYLIYSGYHSGGMTVRLDENGEIIVTK